MMFSVIIPLYNKERHIRQTIESVLAQTFTSFELIVVNDGSKDNSLAVVESINDSRIRIINKPNGGECSARNAGIKSAKGEWVALLDADDMWAKTFLEVIDKAIKLYPEASVFSTGCAITREDFALAANEVDNIYLIDNFFKHALKGGVLNSSCAVIKKSCFDEVGYFNENFTNGGDVEMWVKLSRKFTFCRNSRIAAYYCQDADNRAVGRADTPLQKRAVSLSKVTFSMPPEEREFYLRGIFNYIKLQARAKNWSKVIYMFRKHHIHIIWHTLKQIIKK